MFELTTKQKIALARIIRSLIVIFRGILNAGDKATVRRGGILWDLDLREGIDFAIFLLGGFEIRTIRLYKKFVKPGYTIIDIGANIGAHSLPLAQMTGINGRVIAIEPSFYAFQKLKKNIKLNPRLEKIINPIQAFLARSPRKTLPKKTFSSWPLQRNKKKPHPIHQGVSSKTDGAALTTLDTICQEAGLKIDFLKIDIDGLESEVLLGGIKTIKQFKPIIMFEYAPYLIKRSKTFAMLMKILNSKGYLALDIRNNKNLPLKEIKNLPISFKSSKNILLITKQKLNSQVFKK